MLGLKTISITEALGRGCRAITETYTATEKPMLENEIRYQQELGTNIVLVEEVRVKKGRKKQTELAIWRMYGEG